MDFIVYKRMLSRVKTVSMSVLQKFKHLALTGPAVPVYQSKKRGPDDGEGSEQRISHYVSRPHRVRDCT